ncbi:MAG TPA: hypothetical protein VH054_13755 [Polyangiaceae bacterium]|nr:hypothetical protein [Polyangiaceae bacterium]
MALWTVLLVACGGPGSKTPLSSGNGDAGTDASAGLPAHVISTLPTDVRNPPPFALGSKHAQKKEHLEWGACHAMFKVAGDPAKAAVALGTACASATKTTAIGAAMTGTQNATSSQPITYKFHGAAKKCYRLYGVAGAGVKSLVAVVTDADGVEIAQYHTDDVTPFFAPDEAMCFADDVDAQIIVSVGIGDGPYALSVWAE